ncbi:MAG: glycosyltransferase [Sphingomonadaceae bacterium]|uniref:glycosyltransferase n=1 Tax=Thermaurantiacus sp. TaxID=2820283 RepID=UPI00298EDED0|nr:glycosyltransferase [Thermaurantiacus sp.]MCS6987049.1 glycosyltransferase [Sphingomonadaceae bacterium]MDW8415613.1 glycosyltransferase [Thermaurantiacus sp.]
MRTLLVLHDLAGGGSERVALALAREWAEAGAEVELLLACTRGPQAPPSGLRVHVLAPTLSRGLTSRWRLGPRLKPLIERIAPQVVFLPGNWHLALARGIARARPRPRIVAKISNPPLPALPAPARPMAAAVFRLLARPVDGFAAPPGALAEEVCRLVPAKPLARIANPPVCLPRSPPAAPHRSGRVVAIGRLVPQKDMELAIRAFALAQATRPLTLDIAGDGPERPRLEELARGLPVRFLGHLADTTPLLRQADALLLTSRFEGTPAVALEALGHGIPVIATDSAPFLRDLLDGRPERGRLVASRRPHDVAQALLDRLAEPPGVGEVPELIAHEPARIARAYLDFFRELAA